MLYYMKINEIFTISLVGRPNVGKSTMFNYLVGEKLAITDSMPGLTRDRKEKTIELLGGLCRIIDTAGWHDRELV